MFIHYIYDKEFINNRWMNRYIKFIQTFNFELGHKHHILPRSIFPEFSDFKKNSWNCKILSPRAHFIAHYILSKVYGNKMLYAFNRLSNSNGIKINSKLYNSAMKEFSNLVSEFMKKNNPLFNEETRKKVSMSNTGKKASVETKFKMSKNSYMKTDEGKKQKSEQMKRNNPMLSEEHRKAISKAKTGVPRSEEVKRILSAAKIGINVGKDHFRTKTVLIYDEYNRLKYFCEEGFANFCKKNKLPLKGFNESYKNNKKFETRNKLPLKGFNESYKNNKKFETRNKLPLKGFNESYKNNKKFETRNKKYKEFTGWKIKKLNQINGLFVTLQ